MPPTIISTTDSPETVAAVNASAKDSPAGKAAAKQAADDKETTTASAKEGETTEDSDKSTSDSVTGEEGAEGEDGKKSDSGAQKKIDKQTKKLSKTEDERDYWRELALDKTKQSPANTERKDVKVETKAKPKSEDFDDRDAFIEALTDWKTDQAVEKKLKERQQQEDIQRAEDRKVKVRQDWDKKLEETSKFYDDLDETIENDKIPLHPVAVQVFMESDIGGHLAYWWGKHPKEAKELVALASKNPIAVAKELGKIEDKIQAELDKKKDKTSKTSDKTKTEDEVKTKEKPKPINTVGGSGTITSTTPLGDLSYQDYKRVRLKQKSRR